MPLAVAERLQSTPQHIRASSPRRFPLLPLFFPPPQRAYRQLASVFHPDKHASDELRVQAQEAFSRLQVLRAQA
jgi:hypothetical protein